MRRIYVAWIAGLLTAGCGGGDGGGGAGAPAGSAPPAGGSPVLSTGIQPMTQVDVAAGSGYFEDPYPIPRFGSATPVGLPTFSGTTKRLLSCTSPIRPGCFSGAGVQLDATAFRAQATAAGSSVVTFQNLNIVQDAGGAWQMAVTAVLSRPGAANWSVILHASPASPGPGIPTAWTPDALLVGDLARPAPDNYDGKYFQDGGTLYLVYNKQLAVGRDGVVAQAMASASSPAASAPVPLLGPETANGGYRSELAYGLDQPETIKLIETGNITKINGKYVMTYSDGTYDRTSYKAGIAWSDTFLPAAGSYYKRVQKTDTAGAWGQPNRAEVLYLLQSQLPRWPNYVAGQVVAPGVPAIVADADGTYYLTFAGYDPSDNPTNASGLFVGSHRRPYYVRLKVQVPAGSVASTSPQDLATWVTPVLAP